MFEIAYFFSLMKNWNLLLPKVRELSQKHMQVILELRELFTSFLAHLK